MDIDWNDLAELGQSLLDTPEADVVRSSGVVLRALVVAVGAIILARWVDKRLARRLAARNFDASAAILYRKLVVTGIILFAASVVLAIFGASWSALLTVIGASTVVVALSLQDLLRNYVAGFYMLVERPIRVGDDIRVKGVEGVVSAMELRTTHLVTPEGELVIVPNSTLFLEMVTNYSRAEPELTIVTLSGLQLPLPEIAPAVQTALAPLISDLTRPPEVRVLSVSATGAEARITVHRAPGDDHLTEIMHLLHQHFPAAELREATITA